VREWQKRVRTRSRHVIHCGRKAVGPGRRKASRVVSLSRPKPARTASDPGRAVRQSCPGASRGANAAGTGRRSRVGAAERQGTSEVDPHTSFAEDNAANRGPSLRGLADIGAHQDSGTTAPPHRRGRGRNSRPKRESPRQMAILPGCVLWGLLRRMVTNHESGADTHRESGDRQQVHVT